MLSILTVLALLFLCVAQALAVPPPWDGISVTTITAIKPMPSAKPEPKPSSSAKAKPKPKAHMTPPAWDGFSPRPKPSSAPKDTGHHARLPGTPTGECDLNDHFIFDRYTLRGTRWNITQAELRKAVGSDGGATSSWKWDESRDADGVQTFKARWNLPIDMQEATEDNLKSLIKPFKLKLNCRRHHDEAGPWHPKPDEYVPMEPEPKHEE